MIKLASWNVNSIRARIDRLLEWLRTQKPDVICLQETKVSDDDFPLLELRAEGFEIAYAGQRTYNGVAVLARSPIEVVRRGFEDGVDDADTRFMDVRVAGMRVLCCYVPNGRAVDSEHFARKLDWYARLRQYLEKHVQTDDPVVVCGDMNVALEPIDVYDPAAWDGNILFHPDERAGLRNVMQWGLTDTVRMLHPMEAIYSWWDYRMLGFPKNRGLRIDYIFVTPPLVERLRDAYVDRNARKGKLPSDHAPVVVEFD